MYSTIDFCRSSELRPVTILNKPGDSQRGDDGDEMISLFKRELDGMLNRHVPKSDPSRERKINFCTSGCKSCKNLINLILLNQERKVMAEKEQRQLNMSG